MTDLTRQPPAGWYPDPQSGQQRWWDGVQWGAFAQQQPMVGPPVVVVHARPQKDVGIAYLLAIFLGGFGAHQFYIGSIAAGIIQLALFLIGWATSVFLIGFVFLAVWLIWWIIDLCALPGYVRTANARIAQGLQ